MSADEENHTGGHVDIASYGFFDTGDDKKLKSIADSLPESQLIDKNESQEFSINQVVNNQNIDLSNFENEDKSRFKTFTSSNKID